MRKSISFLLPTYNCECQALVGELHRQCERLRASHGLRYEIVVADDGSPDRSFVARNRSIEALCHVRYLVRERNVGRSAIRNVLAREARCEWLVFIDGDLQVARHDFVERYARSTGSVVVGGVQIGGSPEAWRGNLRYRYEKACEQAHAVGGSRRVGGRDFRTTNFLVSRAIALEIPFDEAFRRYGYEDVLFGKSLVEHGHDIVHIDNPILLDDYEPNDAYMDKTEQACHTLREFAGSLQGYSRLLRCESRLRSLHVLWLARLAFGVAGAVMRSRLVSGRAGVHAYNIYKLLYYVSRT